MKTERPSARTIRVAHATTMELAGASAQQVGEECILLCRVGGEKFCEEGESSLPICIPCACPDFSDEEWRQANSRQHGRITTSLPG
jgi:hypothetical protein